MYYFCESWGLCDGCRADRSQHRNLASCCVRALHNWSAPSSISTLVYCSMCFVVSDHHDGAAPEGGVTRGVCCAPVLLEAGFKVRLLAGSVPG